MASFNRILAPGLVTIQRGMAASDSSSTGLYATFQTTDAVVKANVTNGWPGIQDTSGLGTTSSPYTYALEYYDEATSKYETVPKIVGSAYSQGADFWWNDYWTVSGPSSGYDDWTDAGTAAGKYAAGIVMTAANSTGFIPQFVVIDLEGQIEPAHATQFTTLVKGWMTGLADGSSGELTGAFYSDQSQWESYDLNSLGYYGFVAITPISTSQPPTVSGNNLWGFAGYPGTCVNGNASGDVAVLDGFGKPVNTIQFTDNDSGDPCAYA